TSARLSSSLCVLSRTTTISGSLEYARTTTQYPPSSASRPPLTVSTPATLRPRLVPPAPRSARHPAPARSSAPPSTRSAPARLPVGAVLARGIGHGVQLGAGFGVRIVVGEGPVELAVQLLHDRRAHAAQRLGCEGAGRAVAASADHGQRPLDAGSAGGVGDVA